MKPSIQALRLCVVQHHPLETPGYVLNWAQARGMQVRVVHAWARNPAHSPGSLPHIDEFDALFVLGGPYSVSDANSLPWFAAEVFWLKSCVAAAVPIFGICLGAQLLAHCSGATVEPMTVSEAHPVAELGWVEVAFCPELAALAPLRPVRRVLQWHEDTFQLPPGAQSLAHSAIGDFNQGFKLHERSVMGVQFHPEWSVSTYATLIDGLATAETVEPLRAALSQTALFNQQEALCAALLDFWLHCD